MRGVLSRLTPLEWAFVVGLALPMFAYHITLRSIRVVQRGPMDEVLRWVDVYKSDVLFHLGLVAVGLALLYAFRGSVARYAVFVGLQICSVVVTAVELVAFRFFIATGSTIDFSLIWFALSEVSETFGVVSSEVPAHVWWMLGSSITGVLVLPWAVYFVWRKIMEPRLGERPIRQSLRRPAFAASAGMVCVALAAAPPIQERSYAFARNAFVNVVMSVGTAMSEAVANEAVSSVDTKNAHLEPRPDHAFRKNVVVILMESTRARSVSVYNPELRTTPHLEELAKTSLVAERAYAVVPHTSKALVATLCGIEPRLHMPITEAMPDGVPGKCLARLLSEQGYRTAFFQSATQRFENRQTLVDNMGYGDFHPLEKLPDKQKFAKSNYFGREDDIMLGPSGKWIDEVKDGPFFLTYLTLTPHHNYLAPRRYGRHRFDENDEVNRYLNSVHYVDAFVHNVIEMFKKKGLYEKTIFVILGDHGEGFGEHGRRQHDNVIWEEGLHVPLIVHAPGRWPRGKRVPYLVNQLDVIPTIADLLGYDIADATYPGESMNQLDRQRTIRAHCWYERRCMASVFENEKFIYHFDQQPDEFFDLAKDPLEKNDVAETLEDAEARRSDLIMWRARVNALYRAHNQGRLDEHVFDKAPIMKEERDATFGGWARLVGIDGPDGPVNPGDEVTVTYYFEVLDDIPAEWKLFIHGEAPGSKMQNLDHVPVDGLYPLEDWREGQFIADVQRFRIPRNARDAYTLWMGFYHKDEGRAAVTGSTTVKHKRAEALVIPLVRKSPRK